MGDNFLARVKEPCDKGDQSPPIAMRDSFDYLKELAHASKSLFDSVYIPDVSITKDHTAQIKTDLEYEVLIEKTKGTLCTVFFNGADKQGQEMKAGINELARSLHGKVTFAFVDSNEGKDFIHKCKLEDKLPVIVLANMKKSYIHFYPQMNDITDLKRLIHRYEHGEKKRAINQ